MNDGRRHGAANNNLAMERGECESHQLIHESPERLMMDYKNVQAIQLHPLGYCAACLEPIRCIADAVNAETPRGIEVVHGDCLGYGGLRRRDDDDRRRRLRIP